MPQPMVQPPNTNMVLPTAAAVWPYLLIGHGCCVEQLNAPKVAVGSHLYADSVARRVVDRFKTAAAGVLHSEGE